MGNMITTCCGRCPKKSVLKSEHDVLPRGFKGHRRNLSASFHVPEMEISHDKLNINQATEEELMTLPGITRAIAHSITQYRETIGGFRRVEDVALVTGVGASRMAAIRSEIGIGSRNDWSDNHHPKKAPHGGHTSPYRLSANGTGSYSDSQLMDGSSLAGKKVVTYSANSAFKRHQPGHPNRSSKLDINRADLSQLEEVPGIGPSLAMKIVNYRNNHGHFINFSELTLIPGIGPVTVEKIKQDFVLLSENESSGASTPIFSIGPPSAAILPKKKLRSRSTQTEFEPSHFFLPLSVEAMVSIRPHVELFDGKSDGIPAIRIAAWNLQNFTFDKSRNTGVKEVVCLTILENGISLLAFQELAAKDALNEICHELNSPTIPSIREWRGRRGHWKSVTSEMSGRLFQGIEYGGFLWNERVTLNSSALLTSKKKIFARKPFIGAFTAEEFDFVLISVHLKAPGLDGSDLDDLENEISRLPLLIEAVQEQLPGERDYLVAGDFNLSPDSPAFGQFSKLGFTNTIPAGTFTNVSTKAPEGSASYDNIWISKQVQSIYTGRSEVIRSGLTHPLIPDDWKWNGVVSDHCPVWAEFYVDKDYDQEVDLATNLLTSVKLSTT